MTPVNIWKAYIFFAFSGEVPRGGEHPIPGDISVPDRHAPAATVIDVPPEPRVEFQAEGAATFTEDGAQFRRQMARGDPLELHATSKVSIGSDGSSDISTGVECKVRVGREMNGAW